MLFRSNQALRFGDTQVYNVFNSSLVGYTRSFEDETLVVLVNLYNGDLEGQDREGILQNMEILSSYESFEYRDDATFTLGPRGYVIARLIP